MNVITKWCNVDRMFYIEYNGEDIHYQKSKPNETELIEALSSDNWKERFEDMKNGKRIRVSERIYWQMLGSVPPKRQTATSFYCGEEYANGYYYYFEKINGYCYGQLKQLT